MYTQPIDYIEVAHSILERLEMEYKYATPKGVDKADMIRFLGEQLQRLSDTEVLGWSIALNDISDEGRQHPPTVPEIINAIRKIGNKTRPQITHKNDTQTNYIQLWEIADDRAKRNFFITHCFADVPPVVRLMFNDYNIKNRGWTRRESEYMMSYHYLPVYLHGTDEDKQEREQKMNKAQVDRQAEIIDYFQGR